MKPFTIIEDPIETNIKKTLSYINKNFFDNKGFIFKETSFKISDNKVNDRRFIYLLNVRIFSKPNILTKSSFYNILKIFNISKPFLHHFPNIDFKDIIEIMYGIDGITNKIKIYFLVSNKNNSKIFAIECLHNKCEPKKYQHKTNLDLQLLSQLNPNSKEIYQKFKNSRFFQINKNGKISIHIATDPYWKGLFLLKKKSNLFRQWTKNLITNKEWNKLIKKYGNQYIHWFAISKGSLTFYLSDDLNIKKRLRNKGNKLKINVHI